MPTFSLRVRESANAIPVNGSTTGEYTFSGSHSESTPACSSRSTADAKPAGVPAWPRDTPIRTFMAPSDHGARPAAPRVAADTSEGGRYPPGCWAPRAGLTLTIRESRHIMRLSGALPLLRVSRALAPYGACQLARRYSIEDIARRARPKRPEGTRACLETGGEGEYTLRNRASFNRRI